MELSWLRDLGVAALGGLLGGLAALAGDAVRRRWASVDARRQRRDERSESAAEVLRELLEQAEELFSGRDWDDLPPDSETRALTRDMRRHNGLITDPETRRRIELVIESLRHREAIMAEEGLRPYQVGRSVSKAGRETLEAVLREEALPDASILDHFHQTIRSHYAELERAEREYMESMKQEE